GGLEGGAAELVKAARGEPYKGTGKTAAETGPTGPLPAWLLLIPLAGAALAYVVGRPVADGEEHWARGAIMATVFVCGALLVAGILIGDARAIALCFCLP